MTAPLPKKQRKQRVEQALDHIRITPQQARTAGSLGQVGTATGSLAGATVGTLIGLAAKKPATGAGLGAGIGGALGGGSGAAAGLYAGRPRKKRDGDGDGVLNEGVRKREQRRETDGRFAAGGAALAAGGAGVAGSGAYKQSRALANHTIATTMADVKRNAAHAGMGVADMLRGPAGEASRAKYRRALGQADQSVHQANRAYRTVARSAKNRYALGAGLITAGAGLAAAGHHSAVKKFDENQHRRDRGKFAPKGGMTEAPGARKPRVSDETQAKLARAGLVGAQLADVAAVKSAWHETRNARKVGTGFKAAAKYAGSKAAFPVVAGGLGATLLADHVMRNQAKKLKANGVAKAAPKKNNDARNTAITGAGILAAGEAGGLAASRGAAHHTGRSTLARRVHNSGSNSPWLKGPMRQKAGHIAAESAMKAEGFKALRGTSRVVGRSYGGLALGAGLVGMAAANHAAQKKKARKTPVRPVTKNLEYAMPAPDVEELFAKARDHWGGAKKGAVIGGATVGGAGAAAGVGTGALLTAALAAGQPRRTAQAVEGAAKLGAHFGARGAVAGAAGGALAGAAIGRKKKQAVAKGFDSAAEVFDEVAKFERETKHGMKTGAKWGAGIEGGAGAATGAVAGAHLAGAKGALAGGLASGALHAADGALVGGAIGGIAGAHKAGKRIAVQQARRRKPVAKSFNTADEVFDEIEKFEVETKRAAGTGAKWGAGVGAAVRGGVGAAVGTKLGGPKLGAKMGLAGATTGAIGGGLQWGAVGAGVGALKARKRIKAAGAPKPAIAKP